MAICREEIIRRRQTNQKRRIILEAAGGGLSAVTLHDTTGLTPASDDTFTSAVHTNEAGGFLLQDGSSLYQLNSDSAYDLYQFDLASAFTLASPTGIGSSTNGVGDNERAPFYTPEGYLFTVDNTDGFIRRYDLDDAADPMSIPSGGASQSTDTGFGAGVHCLDFSYDGTKVWVIDDGDDKLKGAVLSTAWDLTTIGSWSASTNTVLNGVRFLKVSDDGDIIWTVVAATFRQYTMSTPFDPTTMGTFDASHSLTGISAVIGGDVQMVSGAATLYLQSTSSSRWREYTFA